MGRGPGVEQGVGLDEPPVGCTYLNFTSSHDGVGLRPVEAILPDGTVRAMTDLCESVGGVVNRRRAQDGSDVPYELASTWYSLMTAIDPDPDRALARHALSQAFVLALRGIPLLYTHVLLASVNDVDTYRITGVARDHNRADVELSEFEAMIIDPQSRAARATAATLEMLRARGTSDAFHPSAAQRVSQDGSVVIVDRIGKSRTARVLLNVATTDVLVDSVRVPALGSVWLV